MTVTKFFLLAVLLVGVHCRYVIEDLDHPIYFVNLEDALAEQQFESSQPEHLRPTRQIHGSTNSDGTYNLNSKVPLVGNDKNTLSAIGSISALDNKKGTYGAAGGGLALDNV